MLSSMFSSDLRKAKIFGNPQLCADGEVYALAFAADGDLWSVEESGVLRRWDTDSGKQLELQTLCDLETLWCFSADGRILASASNDVTLWEPGSGNLLAVIPQLSWVTALAFHPDPAFPRNWTRRWRNSILGRCRSTVGTRVPPAHKRR